MDTHPVRLLSTAKCCGVMRTYPIYRISHRGATRKYFTQITATTNQTSQNSRIYTIQNWTSSMTQVVDLPIRRSHTQHQLQSDHCCSILLSNSHFLMQSWRIHQPSSLCTWSMGASK